MLGSDASIASIGVIPCAIAWLFRLVEEQRETTKTRFSVRVSAVEVFGHDESFKDLLQESAPDGKRTEITHKLIYFIIKHHLHYSSLYSILPIL